MDHHPSLSTHLITGARNAPLLDPRSPGLPAAVAASGQGLGPSAGIGAVQA